MESNRAPHYGAYSFLDTWTLQELIDAASLVQGLRDSGGWAVLSRVLEQREGSVVDQLLYLPHASPVQLERLRAIAAESRSLRLLPDAIEAAAKRKQAAFEEQQRAREEGQPRDRNE